MTPIFPHLQRRAVNVSPTVDRARWLHERTTRLTATEIAPLMGAAKFKTLQEIYEEKLTYLTTGTPPPFLDTPAMRFGRHAERMVLARYNERTGAQAVEHQQMLLCATPGGYEISATPDAITADGSKLIELKTTMLDPDEAAQYYAYQVAAQMLVSGIPAVDLVILRLADGTNREAAVTFNDISAAVDRGRLYCYPFVYAPEHDAFFAEVLQRADIFLRALHAHAPFPADELGLAHSSGPTQVVVNSDDLSLALSAYCEHLQRIEELREQKASIERFLLEQLGLPAQRGASIPEATQRYIARYETGQEVPILQRVPVTRESVDLQALRAFLAAHPEAVQTYPELGQLIRTQRYVRTDFLHDQWAIEPEQIEFSSDGAVTPSAISF